MESIVASTLTATILITAAFVMNVVQARRTRGHARRRLALSRILALADDCDAAADEIERATLDTRALARARVAFAVEVLERAAGDAMRALPDVNPHTSTWGEHVRATAAEAHRLSLAFDRDPRELNPRISELRGIRDAISREFGWGATFDRPMASA